VLFVGRSENIISPLFRIFIPLVIRFELASLSDIVELVLDSLLLTSVLKYFVSLYLKV